MNEFDVIEMIKMGEGWTVDFKEHLPKPAHLALTLVAFANHQGGTVILGVNKKGQLVGFKMTQEDQDNILRAGRDSCRPAIVNLEIRELEVEGKPVVTVHVPEAISDVYSTTEGRYLVREGSENIGVDWRKLQHIMSERAQGFVEGQICEGAAFDDIDLDKVERYRAARSAKFGKELIMPPTDILISRKCLVERNGQLLPTNAGIVLFGKNPQKFVPMSYVTVVKYRGKDQGEGYTDRKDFSGVAAELIDQTVQWIDDRMYHGGKIPRTGTQREEIHQFYIPTVREIVVNAVAHRDYGNRGSRIIVTMFQNRLLVQSPGKLIGNVTPKNIVNAQYARNPHILLTLMEWGYGEAIGQGYDLIVRDLKTKHYRFPKLQDTAGSFIVTLIGKDVERAFETKKEAAVVDGLNDRQKRALIYLEKHESMTVMDLVKIYPKITRRTALADLVGLMQKRFLKVEGAKKNRRYVLLEKRDFQ